MFGAPFSSTNWRRQLDLSADPRLAEMTLPGTHDTATWAASTASKFQTLDLAGHFGPAPLAYRKCRPAHVLPERMPASGTQ